MRKHLKIILVVLLLVVIPSIFAIVFGAIRVSMIPKTVIYPFQGYAEKNMTRLSLFSSAELTELDEILFENYPSDYLGQINSQNLLTGSNPKSNNEIAVFLASSNYISYQAKTEYKSWVVGRGSNFSNNTQTEYLPMLVFGEEWNNYKIGTKTEIVVKDFTSSATKTLKVEIIGKLDKIFMLPEFVNITQKYEYLVANRLCIIPDLPELEEFFTDRSAETVLLWKKTMPDDAPLIFSNYGTDITGTILPPIVRLGDNVPTDSSARLLLFSGCVILGCSMCGIIALLILNVRKKSKSKLENATYEKI
jgi:hypothetical protein